MISEHLPIATRHPEERRGFCTVAENTPITASIDLSRLARNYVRLHEYFGRTVWPVVKADAYGHGAIPVARTLAALGCSGFCVASIEEAMELRGAAIRTRILVLGGITADAVELASRQRLDVALVGPERLESILAAAGQHPVNWHVKVDSGMGRLGFTLGDLRTFALSLSRLRHQIVGVFSHLATGERLDDDFARTQRRRFDESIQLLASHIGTPPLIHFGNTAGSMRSDLVTGDTLARPGIGLYGFSPVASEISPRLEPVLELHAPILRVKTVLPGESVGYGRTFVAETATRVATVACGYADGYPTEMSNIGRVEVDGRPARVLGQVSMDTMSVEVPAAATVGGTVTIYTATRGAPNTIADAAALVGKTPYELLSRLHRRVVRRYWRS